MKVETFLQILKPFIINLNIKFSISNIKILDNNFILNFDYTIINNDEEIFVSLEKENEADFEICLFFEYGYDKIKKLFKITEDDEMIEKVIMNKELSFCKLVNYENKTYGFYVSNNYFSIFDNKTNLPILELKHPYNLMEVLKIFKEIIENKEFFRNYIYSNLKKILYMLPVIKKCFIRNSLTNFMVNDNMDEISIIFSIKGNKRNIGKKKYMLTFEYTFSRLNDFYLSQCLCLCRNKKNFVMDLNYDNDLFNIIIDLIKDPFTRNFFTVNFYFKNKMYKIEYYSTEIWVKNEKNEIILQIPNENTISEIREFQNILKEREKIDKLNRYIINYSFDEGHKIVNSLLYRFSIF